jgi:hypothetical protein
MSGRRDTKIIGLVAVCFGVLSAVVWYARNAATFDREMAKSLDALAITGAVAAGVMGCATVLQVAPRAWSNFCDLLGYTRATRWLSVELRRWHIVYSRQKLAYHAALCVLMCAATHYYLLRESAQTAALFPPVSSNIIFTENIEGQLAVRSLEFGNAMEFTAESRSTWEAHYSGSWYARQHAMRNAEKGSEAIIASTRWVPAALQSEVKTLMQEHSKLQTQPQSDTNRLLQELRTKKGFETFNPNLGAADGEPHAIQAVAKRECEASRPVGDRARDEDRYFRWPACQYRFDEKKLWVYLFQAAQTTQFDLDRNLALSYRQHLRPLSDNSIFASLGVCLLAMFAAWMGLLSPVFYLHRRVS